MDHTMDLSGIFRNAKGAPFLFVEIVKAFLLTYKMSMFQTHCCCRYTHITLMTEYCFISLFLVKQ